MQANRIISALLALASLTAVACGSEGSTSETTAASSGETTTSAAELAPDEINRENAVLTMDVPDLNEETVNLLAPGEDVYATDIFAEDDGDIVNQAIFARNRSVEELLNCTLNPIYFSDSTQETATHIGTTVLAGENLYDLCSSHQAYTVKLVAEGYFVNMADNKYIDWEKPWWNLENMQEMCVGNDVIYFLQGDISLMRMKSLGAVYFNRQMYEELYGDPDALYDTVLDGKWTFDKFDTIVRESYRDLNGNGQVDAGDRFGAFASKAKSVEHFQYACGVTTTTKDSNGIPQLTLNNEHTIDFAEKLYSFYYENEGMYIEPNDQFKSIQRFVNGEYMFAPVWFRHAEEFREMTIDYGIVNFPKYEESDPYRSLIHNGATIFCVPVTSQTSDVIGAVCEAFAFYNYKSVIPAYYDGALKVKYSRDDYTSQILDIISETSFTNFGYVYSSTLNSVGTLRNLVSSATSDFSSWYAGKVDGAQSALDNLVSIFKGN